ncbi:MAG: hypothetical protein SVX43_14245 [Cyanobacteriota bacterium]|nr:hypothetical protein [Cyanobacteriota bacterium]
MAIELSIRQQKVYTITKPTKGKEATIHTYAARKPCGQLEPFE